MDWFWPLKWKDYAVPVEAEAGAFGVIRKYDTHTGVDLYCAVGDMARAVEDGVVVAIEHFTGAPESPWWNPTEAVLVEGASGVVVYGEITPLPSLTVGAKILRKQAIGQVLKVIKNKKPGQKTTMLHLELHKPGTTFTEAWVDKRPETLLDPTPFLMKSYLNPVERWENPSDAIAVINIPSGPIGIDAITYTINQITTNAENTPITWYTSASAPAAAYVAPEGFAREYLGTFPDADESEGGCNCALCARNRR